MSRPVGRRRVEILREAADVLAGAESRLTGVDALTPSEQRLCELAAEGLRNRQIAESLFITEHTVEFRLHHIYTKLGVSRRSELAAAVANAATVHS